MNMNLLYVKWIVAGKSIQASMAMIGKVDDASKLLSQNLKENQKHSSYSILFKLCRSKYAKMMSGTCRIRYCSGLRTNHIMI
mmetsp:Transcript_6292/g.8304  ORF Transcript_6292/g.8304 Transcript_6292/m.8304 type:complete len:82 (-) Transcript_6292:143-388(-)